MRKVPVGRKVVTRNWLKGRAGEAAAPAQTVLHFHSRRDSPTRNCFPDQCQPSTSISRPPSWRLISSATILCPPPASNTRGRCAAKSDSKTNQATKSQPKPQLKTKSKEECFTPFPRPEHATCCATVSAPDPMQSCPKAPPTAHSRPPLQGSGTADESTGLTSEGGRLYSVHQCYVLSCWHAVVHYFYHGLCRPCAAHNMAKSAAECSMSGRVTPRQNRHLHHSPAAARRRTGQNYHSPPERRGAAPHGTRPHPRRRQPGNRWRSGGRRLHLPLAHPPHHRGHRHSRLATRDKCSPSRPCPSSSTRSPTTSPKPSAGAAMFTTLRSRASTCRLRCPCSRPTCWACTSRASSTR